MFEMEMANGMIYCAQEWLGMELVLFNVRPGEKKSGVL
jgi:hypothetical protein